MMMCAMMYICMKSDNGDDDLHKVDGDGDDVHDGDEYK
jgi:hypothetical protein